VHTVPEKGGTRHGCAETRRGEAMSAVNNANDQPSCGVTKTEVRERKAKIDSCLLVLASRVKIAGDPTSAKSAEDYGLAVASLAELIHHAAFCADANTFLPLAEIAVEALKTEPPNLVLATDLILEAEGRLFMRSEIVRFPYRSGLTRSTLRVSAVDVVTKALPLSLALFLIATLLAQGVGFFALSRCHAPGCLAARSAFISAPYVTATCWGLLGGLASVMLRNVTTERLRLNQLRGLYYTTVFKPWLGAIFAAIVYFAGATGFVQVPQPGTSWGGLCLWAILGFVSGFGERLVPDLISKVEKSIGSPAR
jgi:hypothetical protein